MERLIKRLEPASGMKKATKAIFRPLRKEDVKDVLDTIERQKTLFILALQNDYIGLSQAIKESVNLVQNGIQDVLKGISDLDRKQNCHTKSPRPPKLMVNVYTVEWSQFLAVSTISSKGSRSKTSTAKKRRIGPP